MIDSILHAALSNMILAVPLAMLTYTVQRTKPVSRAGTHGLGLSGRGRRTDNRTGEGDNGRAPQRHGPRPASRRVQRDRDESTRRGGNLARSTNASPRLSDASSSRYTLKVNSVSSSTPACVRVSKASASMQDRSTPCLASRCRSGHAALMPSAACRAANMNESSLRRTRRGSTKRIVVNWWLPSTS